MTNQEQLTRLEEIIRVYMPAEVQNQELTSNSSFINDLNINSANLVDIVLDVEDAFDITLENEDMESMDTVGDALSIVQKKLA